MNKASKLLRDFEDSYKEGIKNIIKKATEGLYERVLGYCYSEGVMNHANAINWDYDENTNVGRVWVDGRDKDGMVVILNEFGTGIRGTQDSYADQHGYTVNLSGKGEKGWWYPTTESDPNPYKWVDDDGQLRALTHGLPSKHMFYQAFKDIKDEFGDIINIELQGTIGRIYDGE